MTLLLALLPAALAGDPCPIDLAFHEVTPSWRDRAADLATLQSQRQWLGLSYQGRDPVKLSRVFPSSPAQAAGLQEGDAVLAVDGVAVADSEALGAALDAAGSSFTLAVERGGARQQLAVARGPADPVLWGMLDALRGQECRAPTIEVATEAQRAAVMAGAFDDSKGFRCGDAHQALQGFESGDVVFVRGGSRILLSMPGWATTCVTVQEVDGEGLSSQRLLGIVEGLAAPYVADRHENP